MTISEIYTLTSNHLRMMQGLIDVLPYSTPNNTEANNVLLQAIMQRNPDLITQMNQKYQQAQDTVPSLETPVGMAVP